MRFIYFTIFLVFILACQDTVSDVTQIDDSDYFPLKLNAYKVYEMDTITYDDFGATVRNKYGQMMDIVLGASEEPDGDSVFVLERSFRENSTQEWENSYIYSIEKTISQEIFITDNNLLFKPFVFPLTDNLSWEGILFDASNIEQVIEGELIKPYIGWSFMFGQRYDSYDIGENESVKALQIIEADNTSLINRRYSASIYGYQIGLVSREMQILDSQCINVDPDCEFDAWEDKAEKGYILKQTLIEYGF